MILVEETVFVIMSKDRKLVAKGTPRNRCLVSVKDKKDKKRYLTYSSKGKAEAAFSNGNGFYTYNLPAELKSSASELEAVAVKMSLVVS